MQNLFEIISQAQGGQAVQNIANQFGVSSDQAQKAVEALMPAFSEGLKRNTADQNGLESFLSALGNGGHQNYFEDQTAAFAENAREEGNHILGHLFKSKDVSRAVADQASEFSGIGSDVLKSMLPVLANMVMGGLSKQSQTGGGQLGDIMDTFMKGMAGNGASAGTGSAGAGGGGPLGGILGNILGGFLGGNQQPQAAQPQMPDLPRTGADMFGDLFEAGRNVQDAQTKAAGDIFDSFLRQINR